MYHHFFSLFHLYQVMQSLKFALQPAVVNISVKWTVQDGITVDTLSPPINVIFHGQRTLIYAHLKGEVRAFSLFCFNKICRPMSLISIDCKILTSSSYGSFSCSYRVQEILKEQWQWHTAWTINQWQTSSTSAWNQLKTLGKTHECGNHVLQHWL